VGLHLAHAKVQEREAFDRRERLVHDTMPAGTGPQPVADTADAHGAAEIVYSNFTQEFAINAIPYAEDQSLATCATACKRLEAISDLVGCSSLSDIGDPARE
jgi:hypothetical protein